METVRTPSKQPTTIIPHSERPSCIQLELARDPPASSLCKGIHVKLLTPARMAVWQGREEVTTSCPQQTNHQALFSNTHLTRADVADTYLMDHSVKSLHSWRPCAPARSRTSARQRHQTPSYQKHVIISGHLMIGELLLIQSLYRIFLLYDT